MIKVLILYYLSLKSTHGYEIQKFIQINHMDSWTKIQSGSIYYALAKLEKEGLIRLIREEGKGSKARKIYEITSKGLEELKVLVRKELAAPIGEVGSDKFILYPLLTVTDEKEIQDILNNHIAQLQEKKADTEHWRNIKLNDSSLEVERISFEMMLSSLDYQIQWHQALLSQLDQCTANSREIAKLITTYDFSTLQPVDRNDITDLESLKKQILKP